MENLLIIFNHQIRNLRCTAILIYAKKNAAYKSIVKELVFLINEVKKQRKRLVHFKNTFYLAYDVELSIHTNYETLSFLLDTGLSSKGSAGFGMVVVQI